MYLVGHAIVAFLIAFGLSKKFRVGGVSFALVMLIACLPDMDILFQLIGFLPHKSYTHSLILSLIVVPAMIFAMAKWRRVSAGAAFIYSLAYVSHIAVGDIVVGGTNILYPFGNLMVGTGIDYGTSAHQIIEFMLLAVAAAVVLCKVSRDSKKQSSAQDVVQFTYDKTSQISYSLLIASLIVSFSYLLYGIEILPRLFIETDLELALFILLHLSALALTSYIIFISRKYAIFLSSAKAVHDNK